VTAAIAFEDQIVCTPVPCNAVTKRLLGSRNDKTALIECVTASQTSTEESVIVVERLLLDEIVEDLSGNDTESRSALRPDMDR
jgi:hypothetical protein